MRDDRAVSEIIGFVLVFSLVASTVAIVSVTGLATLQDVRDDEQVNNAERAFDVLADNMADIHQESAPSRATEIKLQNAQLQAGSTVSINVTGKRTGTNPSVTYQTTPIVYTSDDDTRIVYEAGAVFRENRQGGVVAEDPQVLVSGKRIVFPIVQTTLVGNASSVGGQTVRVRGERAVREPLQQFVQQDSDFDRLYINITSPRYELWERYLDDQPGTDCTFPAPENTVECTVDDPTQVYVTRTRINYEFQT